MSESVNMSPDRLANEITSTTNGMKAYRGEDVGVAHQNIAPINIQPIKKGAA
jgi:hypothetical protein